MAFTHFPNGVSNMGVPVYCGIPPIIGQYYNVCIGNAGIINGQGQQIIGSDGNDGLTPQTPLASFGEAYRRCVSGAGDGILVWDYGTNDTGATYNISSPILFDKCGITVAGISSGAMGYNRITLNMTGNYENVMLLTGNDNRFLNIRFVNANTATTPLSSNGGVKMRDARRNYFENVHFSSPINPLLLNAPYSYGLYMTDGNYYNTFVDCTFGNNLVTVSGVNQFIAPIFIGETRTGNQLSNSSNYWLRPKILSSYNNGATTSPGASAILLLMSTALNNCHEFRDALVLNDQVQTTNKSALKVVGGIAQTPNDNFILFSGNTSVSGYLKFGSVVWISTPVSSATGGMVVIGT